MDGSTFAIARLTLPEAAAERLRTLIIEGELAPGARLNERELSERLGVSRTPLREAFRMLAADGLLVQLPNRGAQVVALSRDDVRHAFEVMAALEGLSGELAAARVTGQDVEELQTLQAEMEQAHERHDLPTYYRVNRAIHERINGIAGNPILTQTFKTLNTRLHALRFRSNLVRAKWDQAVAEHRQMIEALAVRDGAGLRDILIRHLKAKRQAVLESMIAGSGDAAVPNA
ncbi:DNA-binding transcriptional regulator, GntR family [Enhydrobacter aerosaccus]|uniref:DNA-binding transcriptional regulator, GntR family n=1 Tax=Enhydrobacter aerosaccus TaxID=225324 RepID=A0A1T4K0L2_9HYPH|nr:GntR family transcriptional regulator [Enhydrobacter aerosaccus]SJZ36016.1 DNA-binding transcriptional regulator, GntR family [Enhydrobacter aerosaccus]